MVTWIFHNRKLDSKAFTVPKFMSVMDSTPDVSTRSEALTAFGAIRIEQPTSQHTHTAIILHGRGSNGPEFAEELFGESNLSDGTSLTQRFPGWRWVIPSSPLVWSTTFQEELASWFDARSLTDITEQQGLQKKGIQDSVKYITSMLDEEIRELGGDSKRVVLGGMSQGGAVAMWTLLCQPKRLGAFFATSTWLPFAADIDRLSNNVLSRVEKSVAGAGTNEGKEFVESMVSALFSDPRVPSLSTPVFMGHGTDDGVVDCELGRQARCTLNQIGFSVEAKEYSGAEQEGHWLKVPEEVDDISEFLERVTARHNAS